MLQDKIIRRPQLRTMVGLSDSSINNRENPRSPWFDPTFPKRVSLGGLARRSAVGWLESEVIAWIEQRARRK
ncbi:AlpA family phage regulatory protein [Dyella sp. A6]|uniref:helix-turn-helix transcriptional regulator n=1 Tax=Dyella aluminiiresistens TaxID=3069105 RepID=UPI002E75B6BA|nr:AlpA family phage regulatory protein [Dyella sp. A6]